MWQYAARCWLVPCPSYAFRRLTFNLMGMHDPAKNERKVQARCLAFTLVSELDWATAVIDKDTRESYDPEVFPTIQPDS